MSLLGTYEHSLDAKGRVSMPAKFRRDLPDELVVVPVPNEEFGKALYVFTEEAYDAWADSFFTSGDGEGGYNQRSKKDHNLRRYLDARSESIAIDSVGRVKLSARLCEQAGIDKDVAIVGQRDHIEIWNAQAFSNYMENMELTDPFAAFLED